MSVMRPPPLPPKAAATVALVPQMLDEFDWSAPPRVEDDMPAADAGASDPAVAPSDEGAWPPMDHEDEAPPAPAAKRQKTGIDTEARKSGAAEAAQEQEASCHRSVQECDCWKLFL